MQKLRGHAFHGSATRIKEHLFGIGIDIESCPLRPGDLHMCLQKHMNKLKCKGMSQPWKKIALASQDMCVNISCEDE